MPLAFAGVNFIFIAEGQGRRVSQLLSHSFMTKVESDRSMGNKTMQVQIPPLAMEPGGMPHTIVREVS